MSIIKSFSVGNGDMFYIKHGSDNFSIIDCCLNEENKTKITNEILNESSNKNINRFISTHPDNDHIAGLNYLDENWKIQNFYCVKNKAIKDEITTDFKKYCELRDSDKSFFINKNCSRAWLNIDTIERHNSGISVLWPDVFNTFFKEELKKVSNGESPNNISPIIKYSLENGITCLWMGDLETDFLNNIENDVDWEPVDVLFAPHHGRSSGKVPKSILNKIKPNLVIIGEADSTDLNYYSDYNTITQNTAKDILFECVNGYIHFYVSNENYINSFSGLLNKYKPNIRHYGKFYYLGTLKVR